jgi:hypothetical protein
MVRGFNPDGGGGGRDFPCQNDFGAHPTSYTMSTGSFQRMKRLGRGAHHRTPLSPEVANGLVVHLCLPSVPASARHLIHSVHLNLGLASVASVIHNLLLIISMPFLISNTDKRVHLFQTQIHHLHFVYTFPHSQVLNGHRTVISEERNQPYKGCCKTPYWRGSQATTETVTHVHKKVNSPEDLSCQTRTLRS